VLNGFIDYLRTVKAMKNITTREIRNETKSFFETA